MSTFSGYKTKAFSGSQKFFVLDPNTGTPSFVQGSDLVAQLTPNSTYVFSESTRTTAQTTDYELGAVIQTGGATATGDGQAGVYLVVAAGEGDFPMDNGLELLTLAGDDTLLERLALNTVGDGSDLVAHTGTDDTVTEALSKRTIYVGSVAELEALAPANYQSGQMFDVRGSKFESDGSQFILRGFLFAWSFGVLPDTGANLTASINEAIDYASGKQAKLIFAGGEYVYDGITRTDSSYWIDIDSINGRAVFKGTAALSPSGRMFQVQSDTADDLALTLSTDVVVGQNYFEVASTAGLLKGMVVRINSNELWPYDNRGVYYKGETHLIESVDSGAGRIYFTDFTRDQYAAANIQSFVAWTPRRCRIQNIDGDMSEFGGDAVFQIDRCYKPEFHNVEMQGSATVGLWLLSHWEAHCTNITARFIGDGVATGYGVQDRGGVGTLIEGLKTFGCRRSFDAHSSSGASSSPCRDYRVTDFVAHGGGAYWPETAEISYGIGNHGPAESGQFDNGSIYNCQYGVNDRGAKTVLSDINIYGKCQKPVDLTFGTGIDIDNVNYYPEAFPNKGLTLSSVPAADLPDALVFMGRASTEDANWDFSLPVKIANCTAVGLVDAVIYSASAADLRNIDMTNCTADVRAAAGTFYTVRNVGNISRSRFDGNRINAGSRGHQFAETFFAFSDGLPGSHAVIIDDEYIMRIEDNTATRVGTFSNYSGGRPIISFSADTGGRGIYELRELSSIITQAGNITFTNIAGTATPESLNGTFGTDGDFTVGLSASGILFAENRLGVDRIFRFKSVG